MNTHSTHQPHSCREFYDLGYERLTPVIPPGATLTPNSNVRPEKLGKIPGHMSHDGRWYGVNHITQPTPDVSQIARFDRWGGNVGVCLGARGDGFTLAAIDADTLDPSNAKIIEDTVHEFFGPLPTRIGQAPKAAYMIRIEGAFEYAAVTFGPPPVGAEKPQLCEILTDTRQIVGAGLHPITLQPYVWRRWLVPYHDLPVATVERMKEFLSRLRARLPQAEMHQHTRRVPGAPAPDQESLRGKLDHIRHAVAITPNDAHEFPTYDDWIAYGYAIKAACGPENEDEGLEIFESFSASCKSKPVEAGDAADAWRRMHAPFHIGASSIYRRAQQYGFNINETRFEKMPKQPAYNDGYERLMPPPGDHLFYDPAPPYAPPAPAPKPVVTFNIPEYDYPDEEEIPPYEFLYGTLLERQLLTMSVAPSGIGKSSLTIVEALALASGLPLLGTPLPKGRQRVCMWNGEDPPNMIKRRVAANMKWYGLTKADTAGYFFVESGFNQAMKLARQMRDGVVADEVVEAVIAYLKHNKIDVFIIDPYVATHGIPENDNLGQEILIKLYARIAYEANCAIHLVHHVTKLGGEENDVEKARGASSLLAGVRVARALTPMTAKEGKDFGLGKEWPRFFRVAGAGKSNNSKRTAASGKEFFRMESVTLANGDEVGVVTLWKAGEAITGLVHDEEPEEACMDEIMIMLNSQRWRADKRATPWFGEGLANVLNVPCQTKEHKAHLDEVIGRLRMKRKIKVEYDNDKKSTPRPMIVEWSDPNLDVLK